MFQMHSFRLTFLRELIFIWSLPLASILRNQIKYSNFKSLSTARPQHPDCGMIKSIKDYELEVSSHLELILVSTSPNTCYFVSSLTTLSSARPRSPTSMHCSSPLMTTATNTTGNTLVREVLPNILVLKSRNRPTKSLLRYFKLA